MKYLKIHSSSLAISEFQIKTALRFHLTLIKMTKITKQLTTSAGEDVGKDLSFLLGGKANWFTCSKISVEDPQQAKSRSTTPRHMAKGHDITLCRHLLSYGHCCSTHNTQEMETTSVLLSDKWIIKM